MKFKKNYLYRFNSKDQSISVICHMKRVNQETFFAISVYDCIRRSKTIPNYLNEITSENTPLDRYEIREIGNKNLDEYPEYFL